MPTHAPRLLVSVRSVTEAIAALEGGADIIDIKEPSRGPLGMADASVIESIADVIGPRVPLSAALGDLSDAPPPPLAAALTYVKIGLQIKQRDWPGELSSRFAASPHARPIVALYADDLASHDDSPAFVARVLDWLESNHAAGLLLDTCDKSRGDLFACLSDAPIEAIVDATRRRGLLIALAGRLAGDSLRRAAALSADIIGVRGAACTAGDRGQTLDPQRLQQVRSLISGSPAPQDQPAKVSAAG